MSYTINYVNLEGKPIEYLWKLIDKVKQNVTMTLKEKDDYIDYINEELYERNKKSLLVEDIKSQYAEKESIIEESYD
jgi:hypothetical protein